MKTVSDRKDITLADCKSASPGGARASGSARFGASSTATGITVKKRRRMLPSSNAPMF